MSDNHDDQIGDLLRLAGPREAVAAERALRVKSAVHAQWQQQTRARSRNTTIGWSLAALAAAAVLVLGVRVVRLFDTSPVGPVVTVATLGEVSGGARLFQFGVPGAFDPARAKAGDTVRAGSVVDTQADGRASLSLASGISVRLDGKTRLRLLSASTLVLDEGAIYVDSGGGTAGTGLEVHTPLGVARDVGTRFEVRLTASSVTVRVRDGLVELKRGREAHEAKAGEELTVSGNESVMRRQVPVDGPEWDWTTALAPPFEIEGRSLRDFLEWIANENDWRLAFSDTTIERKSSTTILHGSIQGLTAREALAAVLPTSGVEHELANGVLLIRPGAGGS